MSDANNEYKGGERAALTASGAEVVIPLQIRISVSVGIPGQSPGGARAQPERARSPEHLERLLEPVVDSDYDNRRGYDENFLGLSVPLPEVTDPRVLSKMDNDEHVIPYQNFSVVMNKRRRLALFVASNVDGSEELRQPEPGDYSRRGLTGLGPNDQEKWITDPRIPEQHQLPDRFYTRDGGAFDKGHISRREDVCWGKSRKLIVRANGDTFHTTNCSPQVADFNRSNLRGRWGELENYVLKQARTDRLSLIAGPVLADDDPVFVGRDERGEVRIQIPRAYWKVMIAREDGGLQAFGFRLEQDLSRVPTEKELQLSAEWRPYLISLTELEQQLGSIRFPTVLKEADQADQAPGEELMRATSLTRHTRKR